MGGGPKTEQGKAITKMNATAHGLRALVPVIPGEDAAVWEDHRAAVVDALVPTGAMEEALAERITLLLWRLGRVARYETEAVHLWQEQIDKDIVQSWKYSHETHETTEYGHTLEGVREEVEDAATDMKLFERFRRMPDDRTLPKRDALAIINMASSEAEIDEDDFDYPLPGYGKDTSITDVKRWTAGMVRICLNALAAASERTVDDLLDACVQDRTRTMYRATITATTWERQTDRYRRARILPDGADLERVMRYEAHLHRQMVQTLHELEAMQERRKGRAAPLARLDVSGLDAMG